MLSFPKNFYAMVADGEIMFFWLAVITRIHIIAYGAERSLQSSQDKNLYKFLRKNASTLNELIAYQYADLIYFCEICQNDFPDREEHISVRC